MRKEQMKLSPPWITLYREIQAMFKNDSQVKVVFNNDDDSINVYVDDDDKADAIGQILIDEKDFGNVNVKVNVVPANNGEDGSSNLPLFQRAFKDNNALSFTTEDQKGMFAMSYVVFAPVIVQFFNDDLTDVHGLASMLYADIARDIFKDDLNVNFCTDQVCESVGIPLGEWP